MSRRKRYRCDFLKACHVLWVVLVDKQTQTHATQNPQMRSESTLARSTLRSYNPATLQQWVTSHKAERIQSNSVTAHALFT